MSDREKFTAYITKYALTQGILINHQAELCSDISTAMIKVPGQYVAGYYHAKDWHRTMASAINQAKEMQAAKLKSIDKQRKRIAALKFE